MTRPETIKKLEKRYNCHIDREWGYYKYPFSGEYEMFKVYSKDGCHWSTVIGYRSLIKELVESKDALRRLGNLQLMIDNGY